MCSAIMMVLEDRPLLRVRLTSSPTFIVVFVGLFLSLIANNFFLFTRKCTSHHSKLSIQ